MRSAFFSFFLLVTSGALSFGALAPAALAQPQFGRGEIVQRLSPDQAREGAQQGRQLPLESLLPRIRAQVGDGQVLSTALEDRGGQRVYVLRWRSSGRLMDLEVDAGNGQVLKAD